MTKPTSSSTPTRPAYLRAVQITLAAIIAASCGDGTTTPTVADPRIVASVTVSPLNLAMLAGETATVTAVPRDAKGALISNVSVEWKSNAPSVAAVDANGRVTAIGSGSATITASLGERRAQVSVSVRRPIETLVITSTPFSAAIGEAHTLEARALDVHSVFVGGATLAWSSSAPGVASVTIAGSSTATVTALSAGTAVITATAEGKSASITVVVGSVEQVGGLWDFVDDVAGASAACADSGTIAFTQTGLVLNGNAHQIGRCVFNQNVVRVDQSSTVIPSQFNTNQIRFTLLTPSTSCQYTGLLTGDRSAMSGTVSCSNSSGTWSAVRARPITSLQLSVEIAVDSLVPGMNVKARVRVFTSAGETFLRPVIWSTTDAQVVTATPTEATQSASIRAVNTGIATVSARFEGMMAEQPVTVHLISFDRVSLRLGRSCGTATVGGVYCWSGGAPTRYFRRPTFTTLSVGANTVCGLDVAGSAYCWSGDQLLPASGELAPVSTNVRFASISAGGYGYYYYDFYYNAYVCGLTVDGTAYCWGTNFAGQLGAGDLFLRPEPITVATGQRFASLKAGAFHTCAINLAGAAYCWGGNFTGALGDGSLETRLTPAKVLTTVALDSVYPGNEHTCALTAQGAAWCWGSNANGQLGIVTAETNARTPVELGHPRVYSALALGSDFTCGLTGDGAVYCWGRNDDGQLGQGSTSAPSIIPLKVNSVEKFTSITTSGGSQHTCGKTATQRVYCWGAASQLGVTGNTSRGPVLVAVQN